MAATAKIFHGTITARIEGSATVIEAVNALLSFRAPGYQFSSAFKARRWDGYTRLLRSDNAFPAGLWPHVAASLHHQGVRVRHVDERAPARDTCATLVDLPSMINLRPYQKEAVAAALAKEAGVLHMATSAGKTEVLIEITRSLARRTIVLAHRRELVTQTARRYQKAYSLPKDSTLVGIVGDSTWQPGDITIAMFQTVYAHLNASARFIKGYLTKRNAPRKEANKEAAIHSARTGEKVKPLLMLRRRNVAREDDFRYGLAEAAASADLMRAFLAEFDVVHFDECHHVPAPTFFQVAQAIPARFRFGYSATPDKDVGTELKLVGATGPAIYEETPAELIEGGYAVPPEIFMLEYDAEPTLARELQEREEMKMLPWQASKDGQADMRKNPKYVNRTETPMLHAWGEYQDGVVDNSHRNKLVQEAAHDLRELGHTILVLVDRIDHGEHLERLLVDSQFLHGSSGMARRKKGLEGLAARTLPIVIATSIFDEGVDVPAISCLINARGGKAEHRAIQAVGRGMRIAEGKDRLIVVDFADALSRRLRKHARARTRAYEGTDGFTVSRGTIDEMKQLWR